MSSAQLPQFQLDDADIGQLTVLIANMLEDHLRASANRRERPAQQPRRGDSDDDKQDHRSALAEERLCLHSAIEHGAG